MSESLLRRLAQRARLAVGKGILRLVNDATGIQTVQIELLKDEIRQAERMQDYGFTSVPFAGAEVLTVAVGGSRDHVVVIKAEHRQYRIKGMAAGEVALHDDLGQKVHLTRKGMVIDCAGLPLSITNTSRVNMAGDLYLQGKLITPNDVLIDGTSLKNHKHGNVEPGSGNSGPPA